MLPIFSSLYCRMGAEDRALQHASTFLVEMLETSSILSALDLSTSLVLMDELGRGTSSYDGMAVASATLRFIKRHGAFGFFVTHYFQLCSDYENEDLTESTEITHPVVCCMMMQFARVSDGVNSGIQFLRKPVKGVTPSSFGVDVAAMANLPAHVCHRAAMRSKSLEDASTIRHFVVPS